VTDAAAIDPGLIEETPGTLVCEGDACVVVGAGSDAGVVLAAADASAGWLDGLLRKQISDQVDRAEATAPRAC
jgi:hypothetical protein